MPFAKKIISQKPFFRTRWGLNIFILTQKILKQLRIFVNIFYFFIFSPLINCRMRIPIRTQNGFESGKKGSGSATLDESSVFSMNIFCKKK